MEQLSLDLVARAVETIASAQLTDEQIFREVTDLAGDEKLARRLIDWIPEAFGFVLAAHVEKELVLPSTFSATAADGSWKTISLRLSRFGR
jgi:hypothetical protein